MNKSLPFAAAFLGWAALFPGLHAQAATGPAPILVESEDFQFKSNWQEESDKPDTSEGRFLRQGVPSKTGAITEIQVPAAGHYVAWTRSYDFAELQPGTRHYRLAIDNMPMSVDSGLHKQNGWRWEKVGEADLAAGPHVLSLQDGVSWARCDAILLAPAGLNPASQSHEQLAQYRVAPVTMVLPTAATPAPAALDGVPVAASLESETTRILFKVAKDGSGAPRVYRQVFSRENPQAPWKPVPFESAAESLFYLYSPDVTIETVDYLPSWPGAKELTFQVAGGTYRAGDGHNPFAAGEQVSLDPVSVRQADSGTVEVAYQGKDGVTAAGTWSLEKESQHLAVSLDAPASGFYSIGFSPFQGWDRNKVDYVELAPLFQKQRLPTTPVMLQSAMTPHPLALVQSSTEKAPFTYIASADPDKFPFEWSHARNSPYGFSLLGASNLVQPTVFSPVLGLSSSKFASGQKVAASFVVLSEPGDWKKGLEDASNDLYKVTDYRQPNYGSLTDAAFNMIDLIKNEKVGGWDPRSKGPYNIESDNTVTQCSPMSYLSAALLTRDEDFYLTRALPSIEFTLSRINSSYAPELPTPPSPYLGPSSVQLAYGNGFYGARYWQGVYELTRRLNPWFKALAVDASGKPRRNWNKSVPEWSEMMGVYQLDPTPEKLAAIKAACDAWIAKEVYGRDTKALGITPFAHEFGPYWWDLLDLYELTGDKKYLTVAEEGAFYTIADVWDHPRIPDGDVTVNQPNQFLMDPGFHVFKGKEKLNGRNIGIPGKDAVLAQVPAWEVAPIGITLEAPQTYTIGGSGEPPGSAGLNNITNCPWSPYLLRLYQLTGREIYKIYARNAIIGRFTNYCGYNLAGFNDYVLKPDYPYKAGIFYYQHIPVHLAFTLDYIFAEASLGSGGQITFPWVKQQGYFWLQTREYGAPGQVYADKGMWPWLDRAAFSVPSPQVNYFGAIGNGILDVVVSNSSNTDADTLLHLDLEKAGLRDGDRYEFLKDGKVASGGLVGAEVPFTLAPRTTAVLRFHTAKDGGFPALKPLSADNVPLHFKLPAPWNEVHAMRIRSPFGKDSVYAFVGAAPMKGAEIQLVSDDADQNQSIQGPPYEFTIPNLALDQAVSFHLVLKTAEGATVESPKITLPGTK